MAFKQEDVHQRRRAPDKRCFPVFMSNGHGGENRAAGHRMAATVRGSDNGSSPLKGMLRRRNRMPCFPRICRTVMQNGDQGNRIR